jgi:hypothetical protein
MSPSGSSSTRSRIRGGTTPCQEGRDTALKQSSPASEHRLGLDLPTPPHDDDDSALVLGGVRREKRRELIVHLERPGSPGVPPGHRNAGVVRQRRPEDDVGTEVAGHGLGRILVAAQELGHEVFFVGVRARGLEGVPLERYHRAREERLAPLGDRVPERRFPAPGGGGEVDGLGGASPVGVESGIAKGGEKGIAELVVAHGRDSKSFRKARAEGGPLPSCLGAQSS